MMGLSRNALWTSHFIHYFVLFFGATGLVTFAFTCPFSSNGAIINYTSPSIIFAFLLLYGTSLITMGFMFSTWFSTATSTSVAASNFIFICYIPYGFINQNLDGIRFGTKMILSLSSPVAMGLGCSVITSWETRAIGVQWSNLATEVSASDKMSMLSIFKMLIFGTGSHKFHLPPQTFWLLATTAFVIYLYTISTANSKFQKTSLTKLNIKTSKKIFVFME